MKNGLLEEKIIALEKQMWEAFASGDSETFGQLVSKEALMICGGSRENGAQYTEIVAQVRLTNYQLSDVLIKVIDPTTVLINYIVDIQCPDEDLSGKFRVSSLWVKNNEQWQLVFNQDSRPS